MMIAPSTHNVEVLTLFPIHIAILKRRFGLTRDLLDKSAQ